jgi:hypothetical protein
VCECTCKLKNVRFSTYLVQPQIPVFDVVALGDLRVECRSLSLELENGHARVVACEKQRGEMIRRRSYRWRKGKGEE